MDGFEQSNLEKEANDSHNTCHQNGMHYNERENALMNKICHLGSLRVNYYYLVSLLEKKLNIEC